MTETNARYAYSTSRKLREREIPVGLQPIFETKTEGKKETKAYTKLPRIYLKDKLGYRLDTLTTFQNDIYQAEQNIRNHKEPMTALEWRLPLAPLPARPDYSRTEPIFSKSRKGLQKHVHPHGTVKSTPVAAIPYTGNWAQRHACAEPHFASNSLTGLLPYLGTEVEDVAFVAESLNHLPHIPSLSFVRQELLLPPKTYFQFARHVYFHNKYLSETDRREAVYHFPGFCSGCQRYCLCYGCERSTEPHYHLDGRHKHADEENGRWPRYSRGQGHGHRGHRLSDMEKFMQDQGLTPEQMDAIEQQAQQLMRQKSLEERNVNLFPRIHQTGTDIDTDTSKRQNARHDDNITEDEGIMTDRNSMANTEDDYNQAPPSGQRSEHTLQDSEDDRKTTQESVHVDIRESGDGMKPRYSRHGYSTDMEGDWEDINDDDTKQNGNKGQRKLYRDHVRESSSKTSHHTGHRGSSKDSFYSRYRTSDEENTSPSPSSKSSNSKRRGLYREMSTSQDRAAEHEAPVPFKIKQRQRRQLKSHSPFSTERKYNIPQGKGFQLKKGERQVTEFKEFSRGDVSWKAPPKYEIRRNDKQTTKFWSSPKQKDQSKKSKKRGSRRLPTSPDSGLDSEKTSATGRKLNFEKISTLPSVIEQETDNYACSEMDIPSHDESFSDSESSIWPQGGDDWTLYENTRIRRDAQRSISGDISLQNRFDQNNGQKIRSLTVPFSPKNDETRLNEKRNVLNSKERQMDEGKCDTNERGTKTRGNEYSMPYIYVDARRCKSQTDHVKRIIKGQNRQNSHKSWQQTKRNLSFESDDDVFQNNSHEALSRSTKAGSDLILEEQEWESREQTPQNELLLYKDKFPEKKKSRRYSPSEISWRNKHLIIRHSKNPKIGRQYLDIVNRQRWSKPYENSPNNCIEDTATQNSLQNEERKRFQNEVQTCKTTVRMSRHQAWSTKEGSGRKGQGFREEGLGGKKVEGQSPISRGATVVLQSVSGTISPIRYESSQPLMWQITDRSSESKNKDTSTNGSQQKHEINVRIPQALDKDYSSSENSDAGEAPLNDDDLISLTSAEPDLELFLNEVIDVENLDVVSLQNLNEKTTKQRKKRKKKSENKAEESRHEETYGFHAAYIKDEETKNDHIKTHELRDADIKEDKQKRKQKERRSRKKRTLENVNELRNESDNEFEVTNIEDIKTRGLHAADTEEDEINTEDIKTHDLHNADAKEEKLRRKQRERRSRKKKILKNVNEGNDESNKEFEATTTENVKTRDLHDEDNREDKQKRKQRERRSRRKKEIFKNNDEEKDERDKEFEALSENEEKKMLTDRIHGKRSEQTQEFAINDQQENESKNAYEDKNNLDIFDKNSVSDKSKLKETTKNKGDVKDDEQYCFQNDDSDEVCLRNVGEDFHKENKSDNKQKQCLVFTEEIVRQQENVDSENQHLNVPENTVNESQSTGRKPRYVKEKVKKLPKANRKRTNAVGGINRKEHLHSQGEHTSYGKTIRENLNSISPIDLDKLPSIRSITKKILSGIVSKSVGNAMSTNHKENSLMNDISQCSSPLIKNNIIDEMEADYLNSELAEGDAAVTSNSKFVEEYESSDEESHFDRAMEEELRRSVLDEDVRKSLLKSFEEADALTHSDVDNAESTKAEEYLRSDHEEHREIDHCDNSPDVEEKQMIKRDRSTPREKEKCRNQSLLSMDAKSTDICVQSGVKNLTLTIQPENDVSTGEESPGLSERIQLPAFYPKIRSKKTRIKHPRRVSHAKILHRLDEDGEPNEMTNELDDIQSFMSELPENDITNKNQSAVLDVNFQRAQSEENFSDSSENRMSKEKMMLSSNSLHTGDNDKETLQNTDIGKNKSPKPSNERKDGTEDDRRDMSANSYLKKNVQNHSGNDHGPSYDIIQDDFRSSDSADDNKQRIYEKADDIPKTSRMQDQDKHFKSDNQLQLRQLDADRITQGGSNIYQDKSRKSQRDSMLNHIESVMSDDELYLSKDSSDKSENPTVVYQGKLLTEGNEQADNLDRKYESQTHAPWDINKTLELSSFDTNQMQEVSSFAILKNMSEAPSQRGYNDNGQYDHHAQTDEEQEKICKDEAVDVPAEMPPTTSPVKPERISTPTSRQLSTPGDTSTNWQISDSRLTTPSEVMTRYNEVVTQLPQVMSPSLRDQHPYTIVDRPKKERVKKTKKEAKEVDRKQSASPVRTPVPQESSELEPVILEKSRENSATDVPSLPPLELPPLPELKEESKEVKTKDGNRTQIQPGQKLKPVRAPLPKKNVSKANIKTPLSKPKKRGKSAAEAPVTSEEMKEFQDPLDFLKQYCIIHQDRLPFYERIYTNIIECQSSRYEKERPLSPRTGMPMETIPEWGEHEMNMFHDMIVINRGHDPSRIGLTSAEQYLEKICYTLEILSKKKDHICDDLEELDINRTKKIADRGKELVRDIHRPDYVKKEKKSKKKKKKKGLDSPVHLLRPEDITDAIIANRIEDKLLKAICKEPEIFQLEVEMQRCKDKLAEIDERIVQLDGEKNILGMYCMQVFFMEQNDNRKPLEFRRAQSALYTKLHPHLDLEMNMDELEGALQLINNNLLSDREFEYLFHILNLPGRRKINFQLFSIVAALSEKVTQMDPFIRKLINKMDYNALATKMDRSKDLFQLICDDESEPTPRGNATASNLALELMAGGLSPENTKYVLSKFNREGTGYVDFLDFVMYIPLFIKIHERIVKDPLRLPMDTC